MVDVLLRLASALAGRYTLERELGRGGMATVWLAQDLKHDRPVALKVLRPEVAAALGPERFLREIKVTARLAHSHILPLLDSGEAGGFIYYVMPFVAGESLRDRLDREKQLPLEDALQVAREVADALGYAHAQDVLHRDVKPENILLQAGHAMVADFGIARAITAAGGTKLTETGIVVGTPAYMSPEQVAGNEDLDGRSDLYALGCVLYEMLAGRPPFVGPTAESVVHQHLSADVPPITSMRPAVPGSVAAALSRALAKVPADRFASVQLIGEALRLPTMGAVAGRVAEPPARHRRWSWVVGPAVLSAVTLGVWLVGRPRPAAPDPNLVAVLPFRTVGVEPTYGEGMVDLLSAAFTGEGGPRSASPQSVMRAWQDWQPAPGFPQRLPSEREAAALGGRLGAGRVILGSIVETPAALVVQASLLEVPSGALAARVRADGPADSLVAIVDRVAAQVLATWSSETGRRLALLATSSPEALRAYFLGVGAYRRGHYDVADGHFSHALDLDSMFVLAALGQAAAGLWLNRPDRGVAAAWAMRERLSPGERALVVAFGTDLTGAGPLSRRRILALRERAVEVAPDRPEAWFLLGDGLHHWGPNLGVPDWRARSEAAFWRALKFDSTLSGPLEHLLESGAAVGDIATVRRVAARVLANEPPLTDYYRWLIAQTVGDTAELTRLRARFDGVDSFNRTSILGQLWRQDAAADFERVLAIERRRAASPADVRRLVFGRLRIMLLNAGRPQAWHAEVERVREVAFLSPLIPHMEILDALYAGGDTAAASAAARRLRPGARDRWTRDGVTPSVADARTCALAQWELRSGRGEAARRLAGDLHGVPRASAVTCAALLDAVLARTEGRPDATDVIERLDSHMREDFDEAYGNLVVARLREARGDLVGALAAARRYGNGPFLASHLAEEGRLAALAGDTAGAVRAYQRYLDRRFNPEPAVRADVERVRDELTRLLAGPR